MNYIMRYAIIIVVCATTTILQADPPDRVGRLSNIEGNVSFLPAGSDEWLDAIRNRPLVTGDRLWNDTNGYNQLQLGRAKLCTGPSTNINVLNLNNNIAQFQLTEGSLNLEVNSLKNNQTYEIDTPNVAFSVQKPGTYRIDVDKSGDATIVQIAKGQGEVYGDNSSYIINSDQAYRFTGTNLDYDANFQGLDSDDFDRWCNEHKNAPRSVASGYVSQDVIGYEDLETAGTWEEVAEYGPVWSPNNVDQDWAPYSNGSWAWIEPWGWNWIGQEDWGFAPYHYGRWVHNNKWYWVPYGDEGAVYAPALVAFIGAAVGYGLAGGWDNNIGWFPLGPGDIYRPPYSVSYNYFLNINRGDRINQRQLRQAYRDPNMRFDYRNRNVNNAITAVPQNAFVQSQNIDKARIRVNAKQLEKLSASSKVTLKPQGKNVNDANKGSRFKPSESSLSRQTISKARVPNTTNSAITPKIREVKPSKPRDISKQRNRDLNNQPNNQTPLKRKDNRPPRDNQILPQEERFNKPLPKRRQDERFNQPLPKTQQEKSNQNDGTPGRFRQTLPEYDPSGGRQLRPQRSNEDPRLNQDRRGDRQPENNKQRQLERQQKQLDRQIQRQQGQQPEINNQKQLERQQRQLERRQQQVRPQIRERNQPQAQPQIRERNQQKIQQPRVQPEVRQPIRERAQPQIREHSQQRVEPQIRQQIQRQAPPAPPPVQQIQRPVAPSPQAAPPAQGQPNQDRKGKHQ